MYVSLSFALSVCGCVAHARGPHLQNNWTGAKAFSTKFSFCTEMQRFSPSKFFGYTVSTRSGGSKSLISRKLCAMPPGVHPTSTSSDVSDDPCLAIFIALLFAGKAWKRGH